MSLANASEFSAPAAKNDTHHEPLPTSKQTAIVWSLLALLVALWGTSIAMFGVPGLYIPAVALVPVMVTALVLISRG